MADAHPGNVHPTGAHSPSTREELGQFLSEQDTYTVPAQGRVEIACLPDERPTNGEVRAEWYFLPLFEHERLVAVIQNSQRSPQCPPRTLEPCGTGRFPDRRHRSTDVIDLRMIAKRGGTRHQPVAIHAYIIIGKRDNRFDRRVQAGIHRERLALPLLESIADGHRKRPPGLLDHIT